MRIFTRNNVPDHAGLWPVPPLPLSAGPSGGGGSGGVGVSRVEWGTGRVPRRTCLPVELGRTTTLLGFGGCCPTPGKGERPPPSLPSAPRPPQPPILPSTSSGGSGPCPRAAARASPSFAATREARDGSPCAPGFHRGLCLLPDPTPPDQTLFLCTDFDHD